MKILFLDDESVRHDALGFPYEGHEVWHAYNLSQFVAQLRAVPRFDVVSFDHDLGGKHDGNDCAHEMLRLLPVDQWPAECWVHSWNQVGAERIMRTLIASGIPTKRRPFAARSDQ